MQVYKKFFLMCLSTGLLYAQTTVSNKTSSGISFPTIESISSPTMPSVSAPVFGQEFYKPGQQNSTVTNSSSSAGSNKADDTETTKSVKNSILSTLTASDLSTLSNMGVNLNSLITDDYSTSSLLLSNLYTSNNNSETNVLLQKVLTELENLKKEYSDSAAKSTEESENQTATSSTKELIIDKPKYSPRILRFSVNGYDLLSTCRTVYISKQSEDGSFLITGDRRYLSDEKVRSETFHILFKAAGSSNGKGVFTSATAVNQDYLNDYSFLYQLSQRDGVTAYKTGNFITMTTDDPNWKLDLLIDLGE